MHPPARAHRRKRRDCFFRNRTGCRVGRILCVFEIHILRMNRVRPPPRNRKTSSNRAHQTPSVVESSATTADEGNMGIGTSDWLSMSLASPYNPPPPPPLIFILSRAYSTLHPYPLPGFVPFKREIPMPWSQLQNTGIKTHHKMHILWFQSPYRYASFPS